MKKIICVGRHKLAQMLAEQIGILYYDKKMFT